MNATPFLQQDAIHIWQTSLDVEPTCLQTLSRLLSAEEKERANRFHFDADRRRFIAARGILRTLLGDYLDRSPATLEFLYGRYGKPFLKGLPKTASLFFNLSHTADFAVYAITRTAPVGIDVEQIHTNLDVEEIAAAFFAPEEARSLSQLSVGVRHQRFYRMWTRKEAYCKACGHGMSGDLQKIDASVPEEAALNGTPMRVGGIAASDVSLYDLNLGEDYAAAVAIESDILPVIVLQGSNLVSTMNPRCCNFLRATL